MCRRQGGGYASVTCVSESYNNIIYAYSTPSNFRLNAHARTTPVVQFIIINVSVLRRHAAAHNITHGHVRSGCLSLIPMASFCIIIGTGCVCSRVKFSLTRYHFFKIRFRLIQVCAIIRGRPIYYSTIRQLHDKPENL